MQLAIEKVLEQTHQYGADTRVRDGRFVVTHRDLKLTIIEAMLTRSDPPFTYDILQTVIIGIFYFLGTAGLQGKCYEIFLWFYLYSNNEYLKLGTLELSQIHQATKVRQ